jgi:hypothetical protein
VVEKIGDRGGGAVSRGRLEGDGSKCKRYRGWLHNDHLVSDDSVVISGTRYMQRTCGLERSDEIQNQVFARNLSIHTSLSSSFGG